MSSLFDRLEDQLRGAAHAQIATRHAAPPAPGGARGAARLRGWLTAGGRTLPVALALGSTAAVVVAALLLLHPGRTTHTPATPGGGQGPTLPLPGSKLALRELRQLQRLLAPVEHSATCRVASTQGHTSTLPGMPARALLRELAVLRRPRTSADRAPLNSAPDGTAAYIHDVRRARVTDGVSIFLVPFRFNPRAGQPSVRCMGAEARAVRRGAGSIQASIRVQTVDLGERLIAYARRMLTMAPFDSVCVIEVHGHGLSSDCGSTSPRELAHIAMPSLAAGSPLRQAAYIAAVPNGVASATLSLPAWDGHPATTLRGTAAGNVLVIPAPAWISTASRTSGAAFHGLPQPTHLEWRDRSGRVIARLTAPNVNHARGYCDTHRLQCLLATAVVTSSSGGSSSDGETATAQPSTIAG